MGIRGGVRGEKEIERGTGREREMKGKKRIEKRAACLRKICGVVDTPPIAILLEVEEKPPFQPASQLTNSSSPSSIHLAPSPHLPHLPISPSLLLTDSLHPFPSLTI